jgi:L-alanine-DL-glutamate epimerase-like enolase superfamily enzyme
MNLGIKLCVEDTWGSDIVTAAALHLAASTNPKFLLNVCDLSHYVGPRLDENAPQRARGFISPKDNIGLGVNPDLDVLGEPDIIWT